MAIKEPTKVVATVARRALERKDGSEVPVRDSGANENIKLRSTLVSKNVVINGRRTSVRMEPEVWKAIDEITHRERIDRNHIFSTVANRLKPHESLSSAIRVFVICYYRDSSTESGHVRAGHGARARD